MYKLTRKQAAKELGISTRSVDRYIKSGKLRSKKDGKIVYVNNLDVDNLSSGGKKQEIIIEKINDNSKNKNFKKKNNTLIYEETRITKSEAKKDLEEKQNFTKNVYSDLKLEIQKKDEIIQELSIRLGRAEEIAKNSVNLIDYKKSQFLLEESKNHLNNEIDDLKLEKKDLEKKLRYEKSSNIILIFIVIILFVVSGIIWFMQI